VRTLVHYDDIVRVEMEWRAPRLVVAHMHVPRPGSARAPVHYEQTPPLLGECVHWYTMSKHTCHTCTWRGRVSAYMTLSATSAALSGSKPSYTASAAAAPQGRARRPHLTSTQRGQGKAGASLYAWNSLCSQIKYHACLRGVMLGTGAP
jgi:hypothetical protein